MSKEKLTIEHLAPYLPYGLKIREVRRGTFKNSEDIEEVVTWSLVDINLPFKTGYRVVSAKPILRPLSDLTKEIEHNGEKFIPWYELEFGIDKDLDIEIIVGDSEYLYIPYIELRNEMQKLFEWHFDVFGLIEKGLALNLNDLKDE